MHSILGSYARTGVIAMAVTVSTAAADIHVFTSGPEGFSTHSFWYDDGHEVTVVDTQFTPALAEMLVADIQKQTRSPIARVIVTHPSPDKFNALSIFHRLGAISFASVRTASAIPGVDAYKRHFWIETAKAFTAETYPKVELPKELFSDTYVIHLRSGATITLLELPRPGVAADQTVVRIDGTGDLIVGDLVSYKAHAWLEGAIVNGAPHPDLASWKADLAELPRLGNGIVYGGRGKSGPVSVVVAEQTAYLDRADAIVSDYVAALGGHAVELRDAKTSHTHYLHIQAAFAHAFPDYEMPELIGYGVYGLALSKLKPAR